MYANLQINAIFQQFQFRRFSEEVSTHDLVSDVQFEILKLLSEKDDLQRENEVLKHYRQSYIELMTENNQLREKIELMELSRSRSRKNIKSLSYYKFVILAFKRYKKSVKL